MRFAFRCFRGCGALAVACLAITSSCSPSETNRNPVVTGPYIAMWKSLVANQGAGPMSKHPASFEANRGQAPSEIKFISRGPGYDLLLTSNGAVFSLVRSTPRKSTKRSAHETVTMEYSEAQPSLRVSGFGQLPTKTSYFKGNEPAGWITGVPNYGGVMYSDVYPGIDQVYYANGPEIEYDFIVRPGSNPQAIKLRFSGQTDLSLNTNGDLVLRTTFGEMRHKNPHAYQVINDERRCVSARYVVESSKEVSFAFGEYDESEPIFIDPVLQYSTYIGGAGREEGNAIAVDPLGNIYVAGFTDSSGALTATPGDEVGASSSSINSFVLKLSSDGQTLLYSVHLSACEALGLAVDSDGYAYVTGQADPDFAVTPGALQTTSGGGRDAFVAKLDPTGSSLVYSTFIGGSEDDRGLDIAIDASGSAYVCGETESTNFPSTPQSFQPGHAGGAFDAFVTKLTPTGTALAYSTYLGGNQDDRGQGIAVDSNGYAYVTGSSDSKRFPTTPGSYQGSDLEFFITKLSGDGSTLVYSVVGLGGKDIAVDVEGSAYVTGTTSSKKLGATGKPYQSNRQGMLDAFFAKLNSEGAELVYATYLGGEENDYGSAIGIDQEGNAYVTGTTESRNFPTVSSLQPNYGGFADAFVAEFNPKAKGGASLVYSTLLGGGDTDVGEAIAILPSGAVCAAGSTRSLGFPTASPLQPNRGGGNEFDAFVVRIEGVAVNPQIDSTEWVDGRLYVFGKNFDFEAKIFIDDNKVSTQSDVSNPTTKLFSRAARRRIAIDQTVTLQVRNSDGRTSNQVAFTRPGS